MFPQILEHSPMFDKRRKSARLQIFLKQDNEVLLAIPYLAVSEQKQNSQNLLMKNVTKRFKSVATRTLGFAKKRGLENMWWDYWAWRIIFAVISIQLSAIWDAILRSLPFA